MLEDLVRDEDGAVGAQREGDGVGWAGIEGDDFPALVHPDGGVEGIFAEVADNNPCDSCVKALNGRAQKVVRHGARRCRLFDFESDGICLKEAHPDGEDDLTGEVVEYDDGLAGGGVHHQAADAYFNLRLKGLRFGFGLESGQVHAVSVPLLGNDRNTGVEGLLGDQCR